MLQALKYLESEYDDQFDNYLDEHSCQDKCCENWKSRDFLVGLINAGYLMYSQQSMGLGTFLSKFSNLTNAIIDEKEWSIFDLDMEIKSDQSDKICSKMGKMDKFLSEYFKELGVSIGFNKNHTLSLFDLPSILSPALGGSQTNTKLTKVYHIKYHSIKDICLVIVFTLC